MPLRTYVGFEYGERFPRAAHLGRLCDGFGVDQDYFCSNGGVIEKEHPLEECCRRVTEAALRPAQQPAKPIHINSMVNIEGIPPEVLDLVAAVPVAKMGDLRFALKPIVETLIDMDKIHRAEKEEREHGGASGERKKSS